MADLHVELLAVADCPHFERTRRNLEAVLREGIIETPIQLVLVGSLEDAEFLDFRGSPTVRVNGRDVDPRPDLPVGLGCRTYSGAAGEALDGPPVELLRSIVREHRRGRLEAFRRDEAGRIAEFARQADAADPYGGAAATQEDDRRPADERQEG